MSEKDFNTKMLRMFIYNIHNCVYKTNYYNVKNAVGIIDHL